MWQGAGAAAIQGGTEGTGSALGMYAGYRIGQKTDKQAFERQVWLASHAHQMEVEDLRAAGLNPILSAGGAGAHASPVTSNTATSTMTGGEAGRRIGASFNRLAMAEIESRIKANNSASARDLATAENSIEASKEIHARRVTEYGDVSDLADPDRAKAHKNEKGEIVVTPDPWSGLKRQAFDLEKNISTQRAELMLQQAKAAGYENVEAAARAGLYEGEKGKWIKAAELLIQGLRGAADTYRSFRGGQAEKQKGDYYYERSRE